MSVHVVHVFVFWQSLEPVTTFLFVLYMTVLVGHFYSPCFPMEGTFCCANKFHFEERVVVKLDSFLFHFGGKSAGESFTLLTCK